MLTPGNIEVGTVIPIRGTFRDQDDVLTDPEEIVLCVRRPCGSEDAYTFGISDQIERVSEGIYLASLAITEAGRWFIRWETTEPTSVVADNFTVQVSPFSAFGGDSDYA